MSMSMSMSIGVRIRVEHEREHGRESGQERERGPPKNHVAIDESCWAHRRRASAYQAA